MLYEKRSGNKSPSRTYGGKTWYGGFSDHLPIFCVFNFAMSSDLYHICDDEF